MKLYIKYMVSLRCKMLVKQELKNLGLNYVFVDLGVVEIMEDITPARRLQLKERLLKWGLELMDSKKSILIEQIKNVIVKMVHESGELPKTNYSDFISEKLNHDYTYLANIFSEVNGMTIQHFIILLNVLRRKIGFLFQSAALYDSMSVFENLEFPMRRTKLSEEEKSSAIAAALVEVGLSEAINKMPTELSGGMRKRLGLARTMIVKPQIMLYDEPTTGLDPITAKEISKLILEVQKKSNTSSIIITHDMECAKITANRIVVLKDGKIAAEGTYEELEQSEDEWIRSFFV